MAENAAAVGTATTGESSAPAAEVPELKGVKSKAAREFYMKNVANKPEETPQTDEPKPEGPKQAEPNQEPAEQEKPKASFDDLLNDEEYKGEFNKRVQDIVQKRIKNAKASEDKLTKLAPLLDLIAHKYNVDLETTDIDELVQKVTDDDELYEQEALEKGLPVDALKQIQGRERERSAPTRRGRQAGRERGGRKTRRL